MLDRAVEEEAGSTEALASCVAHSIKAEKTVTDKAMVRELL